MDTLRNPDRYGFQARSPPFKRLTDIIYDSIYNVNLNRGVQCSTIETGSGNRSSFQCIIGLAFRMLKPVLLLKGMAI